MDAPSRTVQKIDKRLKELAEKNPFFGPELKEIARLVHERPPPVYVSRTERDYILLEAAYQAQVVTHAREIQTKEQEITRLKRIPATTLLRPRARKATTKR